MEMKKPNERTRVPSQRMFINGFSMAFIRRRISDIRK
jgi:hypothetical protein